MCIIRLSLDVFGNTFKLVPQKKNITSFLLLPHKNIKRKKCMNVHVFKGYF